MAVAGLRALAAATVLLGASAVGLSAQEAVQVPIPVLTLDLARLFDGSRKAERVAKEFELRREELAAENRRFEEELTAEELDLTELRPTLEPDEFRALAAAFDAKVQAIRTETEIKLRDLQRLHDEGLQDFLLQITPVLAEIVRERGALMVLDRRSVLMSDEAIDITDEAIARTNAFLDSGATTNPAPDPEPEPIPGGN
ncbi:MAG: OmpH family outer membrane protein [Rhodobacteraceae bacterium]|nr:OmpH family outer membrane protein [Paracoccaceae bacterium]